MCEIFSLSSRHERNINEELREFFSHSPDHPNGWGLMVEKEGFSNWEKEPVRADKSVYLKNRLRVPVNGRVAMAHIRRATIGNENWNNCHPFCGIDRSGRRWILQHNGTIFEYDPMNKYVHIQTGETDSERILLYILDRINERIDNKGDGLTAEERFEVLDDIVCSLSYENKLNLNIYDEELLYVHTNCEGTLHLRKENESVMFSTRPLKVGNWQEVPMTRLLAYKNGEMVLEGKDHGVRYIEDQEKLKALFLAYAVL